MNARKGKFAIGVVSVGFRPWLELTYPTVLSYARSIGATPLLLDRVPSQSEFPFEKMADSPGRRNKINYALKAYYPGVLLRDFEKVAILDDTCIVAKNAANLFEEHRSGHVAAVREPALRGKDTREEEENRMFAMIRSHSAAKGLPQIQEVRERYVNSGVVVYDGASESNLSAASIIEAQPLLHSTFPHQTLMYYLLARNNIPIQLLPCEFNHINVFRDDRQLADRRRSQLADAHIYHITGWWKGRLEFIELLVKRLEDAGRL